MTTLARADDGPPRSRIHRRATGLLTQSWALAATGAAIVFAANHSDALFRLDVSLGQALETGLSFIALVGTLAVVRRRMPRNLVPPEGKKLALARIKKTRGKSERQRTAGMKGK